MRNIQETHIEPINNDETTINYIYLYRNEHKDLLYVGIAMDPYKRFSQHKKDKTWFDEVKYIDCAVFSGRRSTVESVESSLIEEFKPLYNKKFPDTYLNKTNPRKINFHTYEREQFSRRNEKSCVPQPAESVMKGYKAAGFIDMLGVKEEHLSKVRKVFARYGELFQNKSLEEMTLDSNDRLALANIYRSLSWGSDELTQKDERLLQDELRSKTEREKNSKEWSANQKRYAAEKKAKREKELEETKKAIAERQKKRQAEDAKKEKKTKSEAAAPIPAEPKDFSKEFELADDLNHTISILRLAIRQRDREIEEAFEKNLALEIEIIKLKNQLKERSIWRKILNLFKR